MRTMRSLSLVALVGCGSVGEPPPREPAPAVVTTASATASATTPETAAASPVIEPSNAPVFERGYASWYGAALAGHPTASGERFDPDKLTAAHRTLKLGTWLEVRRTDTGHIVRVRVNDRGPFKSGRVIDLSASAAEALGMMQRGVAPVLVEVYDTDQTQTVALRSAGND